VLSARERALGFLRKQAEWVAAFRRPEGTGAWSERDGRISGSLGALRAAELISEDEARNWRAWLLAGDVPRPAVSNEARAAADRLLSELLEAIPPAHAGSEPELHRFEGALGALVAVAAADGREWDERLRTHLGWASADEEAQLTRELNAGGSMEELVAVHAGPPPSADGVRVLYMLRFADGISVHIHRADDSGFDDDDDWWDADLTDNIATSYAPGGSSGGDGEQEFEFRTPVPPEAIWIEVHGVAKAPIRVDLR
jgi:hypothetical protein